MPRSALMLRLTRTLARVAPGDPLSRRLCLAFVEVAEASSGAISLGLSTTERSVLCSTSQAAARFEDAQDVVRQGPTLDALRTGATVVCLAPREQRVRWPALTDVAVELGIESILAIPMRPADQVVGVLTLHHLAAPARLATPVPDLEFLSSAVGAAILGDIVDNPASSAVWGERDRVAQATGMVIAQLDLDPDDALAVLRAHAYAEATTVLDVSRLVISRELEFTLSGPVEPGSPA